LSRVSSLRATAGDRVEQPGGGFVHNTPLLRLPPSSYWRVRAPGEGEPTEEPEPVPSSVRCHRLADRHRAGGAARKLAWWVSVSTKGRGTRRCFVHHQLREPLAEHELVSVRADRSATRAGLRIALLARNLGASRLVRGGRLLDSDSLVAPDASLRPGASEMLPEA